MSAFGVMWAWLRWRRQPEGAPTGEQAEQRAVEASRRATEGLRQEIERWPRIADVAGSTHRRLHRNHFGEAMLDLFKGDVQ